MIRSKQPDQRLWSHVPLGLPICPTGTHGYVTQPAVPDKLALTRNTLRFRTTHPSNPLRNRYAVPHRLKESLFTLITPLPNATSKPGTSPGVAFPQVNTLMTADELCNGVAQFNADPYAEQWLPVVGGYEGRYEVSNHYRVRSVEHRIVRKDGKPLTIHSRIRRPWQRASGVLMVTLMRDGQSRSFKVHHLVEAAFAQKAA